MMVLRLLAILEMTTIANTEARYSGSNCANRRNQALQNRHRRSLPRSTRIDRSLVGLLTCASQNRSCLPKAFKPQWRRAPVLRAYSGGGRAGFSPASQNHQAANL